MSALLRIFALAALVGFNAAHAGERLRIAAAADLQYALADIVEGFRKQHPDTNVDVVFGSSGKFHTQIRHGAPFDLFFSADLVYARLLREQGLATTEPRLYAIGRLVLWSPNKALAQIPLRELPGQTQIKKFAMANPDHAPYGRRAQEALEHEGVWNDMKPRLVFGENIAHAAQFVESGAAQAGIIALSLAMSPALANKGHWTLIPDQWHQPLEQAYVITARAADNPLAANFARYLETPAAREVMRRYGFALPGE